MELKFIGKNGGERVFNQPELVKLTDERFADLAERKGQFFAEVGYFMFMTRLHITLHGNEETEKTQANSVARFVLAALKEVYGEENTKLEELMEEVNAITSEVLLAIHVNAAERAAKEGKQPEQMQ